MSEEVAVFSHDAVHIRVQASEAVAREISDYFSFEAPGARFMPSVRAHKWDGRVRLFRRGLLYAGLLTRLREFCVEREYELVLGEGIEPPTVSLQNCCTTTVLPQQFTPRVYQMRALDHGLKQRRAVFSV